MEKKIGFIGCGNMGKAILGGLIASGQVLPVRHQRRRIGARSGANRRHHFCCR